jgi:hypothetical protein
MCIEIGALSNSDHGWTKELNYIGWNSREPVYDIRTWIDSHKEAGKGITLTIKQTQRLRDLLNSINLLNNDGFETSALSNSNNGWTKELNYICSNGGDPGYDIRTWSDNHNKAGKGVTLTINETIKLRDFLNRLNLINNNGFIN